MNKKNCIRKHKEKRIVKAVSISINQFDWIKKNKLSITTIFQEALKELGYKEE